MPQNSIIVNKNCYFIENMPSAYVSAAFSNRNAGNMSLSYGDTAGSLENRKIFLGSIGCAFSDLVSAKQVHSNHLACVSSGDKGKGALSYEGAIDDTDALITDTKNLPLAVFTADCLSVFIYDPLRPAIGMVHAGWRSSKENILINSVKLMQEKFNTDPTKLYLGFGPSMRGCCYEVGDEFKQFFPQGLEQRQGCYYLDLAAINTKQAQSLGVKSENIWDSGICTSCQNKEFFSYRKEGASCGRAISVIMLK
jgi:YfiH family protein